MYSNDINSLLAYVCERVFFFSETAKLLFPLNYDNCAGHFFFQSGKLYSDWMTSCPCFPVSRSVLLPHTFRVAVMPGSQLTVLVVYVGCGRPAS